MNWESEWVKNAVGSCTRVKGLYLVTVGYLYGKYKKIFTFFNIRVLLNLDRHSRCVNCGRVRLHVMVSVGDQHKRVTPYCGELIVSTMCHVSRLKISLRYMSQENGRCWSQKSIYIMTSQTQKNEATTTSELVTSSAGVNIRYLFNHSKAWPKYLTGLRVIKN